MKIKSFNQWRVYEQASNKLFETPEGEEILSVDGDNSPSDSSGEAGVTLKLGYIQKEFIHIAPADRSKASGVLQVGKSVTISGTGKVDGTKTVSEIWEDSNGNVGGFKIKEGGVPNTDEKDRRWEGSGTVSSISTSTSATPTDAWKYAKPEGISPNDDMTLNESSLKLIAYGTSIPAGTLFNYGAGVSPIDFESWAAKNSGYNEGALVQGKAEALARVAGDCLNKKLVIKPTTINGKENAYCSIMPVNNTGTEWKIVPIVNKSVGNLIMPFTDTVYVPCKLTKKEIEADLSASEDINQMGVWNNVPKTHKFREGDIVHIQICGSNPKASTINKLYYVSNRPMNKNNDTYKNHYAGGEKISSKDFIQLRSQFPGNQDSSVCYGVATLVKRGKKQGGGTTRPVRQAVTKYF